MVGPVGGFQQVPLSSATQPAASDSTKVSQREQQPEENRVQRQQEDPASGVQRSEKTQEKEESKEVRAEKREEAQETREASREDRGSVVDISV